MNGLGILIAQRDYEERLAKEQSKKQVKKVKKTNKKNTKKKKATI